MLRLRRALLLVSAAVLAAAPAAGAHSTTSPLLRAINLARAAHGLPPVHVGPHLARAARAHSQAMLATQTFAHGSFAARLRRFHVTAPRLAENLAWATGADGSAAAIVEAWLASPPHRRNLLGPAFTLVGIGESAGSFQGAPDARVVTVDFAG